VAVPERLTLLTESFPDDPALDTAVSQALMLRAASGEAPQTLRIALPGEIVAFGRRDVVSPGYPAAVRAAREGGFEAIERLAGGRAAVFTDQTISLAHAVPDPDPRPRVNERFEATAQLVARALARLGVDARVGEVEGEYCPGAHSVNAGGVRKVMGVGQRLVSGGAHVGAVVVVEGAGRVNAVLGPVYDALGLDWRPAATGAVAAEAPGTTWEDVAAALRAEYAERYELVPGRIDEETMALARELAPGHLSPTG
jgi:octanoyl-[GcvH]:protein N-octanoyltransferase